EAELPEGWEDRTLNVLAFPRGAKKPVANVTISRQLLDAETRLGPYIDQQLKELAKTCPRFSLLNREETTLDGEPGEHVVFTWRAQDGVILRQEQTVLLLDAGVVLVITATAPKDKFESYAEPFRSFVGSFRLRKELAAD
ncbi:MAG TPA: DcrB-related protein, partial [Blastocatellia bacterium]|nr:DcrB-related protein [Blastocatellia bacterium]